MVLGTEDTMMNKRENMDPYGVYHLSGSQIWKGTHHTQSRIF